MTKREKFIRELAALLRALKPTIADDYRCTDDPDDNVPGIQITIGADKRGWSYQTGDNSYTGGAYGYAHWGIGHLYRRSNSLTVAREIVDDLESTDSSGDPCFFYDDGINADDSDAA